MIDHLKSESEKDFIYHYTNAYTAMEKILNNMKLKFSPLKDLHDPREYKDLPTCPTTPKTGSDALSAINDHLEVNKKVNEFIKTRFMVGCFCKSEYLDEPQKGVSYGYSKARMWAQYADRHSGICLVLSKKSMESNIQSQIGSEKVMFDNVEYKNCSFINCGTLSIDVNQYSLRKEEYLFDYTKTHSKDLFFTKQRDYRDENEYRIVYCIGDSGNIFVDIKDSLKGIVLGDSFNKLYLGIIKDYVINNNLFCYQTSWDSGEPYTLPVDFKK